MAKSKAKESQRTMRPAATPEARENQLVSLAVEQNHETCRNTRSKRESVSILGG